MKVLKVVKPTNKKRYDKTLGTSVISLREIGLKFIKIPKVL